MAFLKAKKQSEEQRKDKSNDRMLIYHDDWQDLLDRVLQKQFHPDNYKNARISLDTSQNILKRVIQETSLVYKEAPTRTIQRDGKTLEQGVDLYNDVKKDVFMKKINRYMNLLNDVIIHVYWDDELERVGLKMLTPAVTSVVQDPEQPERAKALFYDYDLIDTDSYGEEKYCVYWDAENHFIFNKEKPAITKPPSENNPEKNNFYGELPFVFVHKQKIDGRFWNPTSGNDLVEGTVWNGVKKTGKNYLLKTQSFKQPYVTGEVKIPPEMRTDPLTVWMVKGVNATMGTLDLMADFDKIDRAITKDANDYLATYGLSLESFSTTSVAVSGRALEVKNRGLRELREDQIEIFREVEQELLHKITIVNNYHNSKKIPEGLNLKIDFGEIDLYTDPMDLRTRAEWDLKKGIISPAQFYMTFNPDVKNEDEAKRIISENLEAYKGLIESTDPRFFPDFMTGGNNKKTDDQE